LSLNKKVTKEVSQRGARSKCAPFGNPRRTYDGAVHYELHSLRYSGSCGDARRGIHKGAAPVREQRAFSAPCACFF